MHHKKSTPSSPGGRVFGAHRPMAGSRISPRSRGIPGKKPCGYFIFLYLIIGAMMYFSSKELVGQSLAGTWQESQYNVKMVLSADGTYILEYPNGRSQGRYGLSGQSFCMQDVSGTNPVCYTVTGFTGDTLVLRDINGMVLNYRRLGGTGPGRPGATQPRTAGSNIPAGNTLAQKDGFTLTAGHFDAGVGIIQFVIGQSIKPSEVRELESKLLEEFQQAPAEVVRQLDSLANSLKTVRTATDPVRIGLARQEIFSALYQATYRFKESDKPLMIQVMNRYIKVLAYDQANKLVLTDRDAVGMLNYLVFNSEIMGQPVQLTETLQQSVIADLVNKFPAMSIQQKRLLCTASLIWQLLEYNWNKMTPAQKQQYKSAYYTQIGRNIPAYQPPPTGSGYNPGTAKSPAEQMREYNARQNMFRMMNDMNLNSHALSLNIIENIGGTGNYWKVVDY